MAEINRVPGRDFTVTLLGKRTRVEHVWGLALTPGSVKTNHIYIAAEMTRRKRIEVFLHEALHIALPDLSEAKVTQLGRDLSRMLFLSGEI